MMRLRTVCGEACTIHRLCLRIFSNSTSTNGIMSVTTCLCAFLLLVSNSSAEIFNKSWWNNTVFYHIYIKSFYDSNGDGIGDLKGITSKLPYIADTGINAIILSPFYLGHMGNFGYDTYNYTEIDPMYGTLDDFKTLLAKAHELGIKVIESAIFDYSSDKHPWFQKALQGDEKYKGYYIWAEGKNKDNKTPPNNWISLSGSPAWTYVDSLKQWYLNEYDHGLPDINYSNPDLLQEVQNIFNFYLDLGVDGFNAISAPYIFEDKELRDEPRSNAPGATQQDYNYLDHIYTVNQKRTYELFRNYQIYIDQYADQFNEDQKLLMIEAYTDFPHTIEYYNYDLLPFNFEIIKYVTANSSAEYVKGEIDLYINSLPSGTIANWVLGNPDYPRVASRFPGRLDQMTMLSMILPGIAVTYYGDEIGMVDEKDTSCKDKQNPETCNAIISRTSEQTPFQWNAMRNAGFSTANSTWLPVNPDYKELNLEKEMGIKNSHYDIYKDLAHLHGKEPALTKGSYRSFTANNGTVLGVIRNSGNRFVQLLINFNDISQNVDLSDQDLPKTMKLKVASSGSQSSLKQQVDIENIYLPKKAAAVYTSLNIQ